MTNLAFDARGAQAVSGHALAQSGPTRDDTIARIPGVIIHAFCETPATLAELEQAGNNRRMARANLTSRPGGVKAAIDQYRDTTTPNLIIVESQADRDALIADLDALAAVCDVDTKVVVIGATNDIALYREVVARGVSEYLPAPVTAASVVATVARVFSEPGESKPGRVYAFIGAKGGVGSSTIAHNIAWTLGRHSGGEVLLADLDLPFGTASLNFDLEPPGGIAEALGEAARLDEQMFERLLTRCDEHLRLLAAPARLDTPYDIDQDAFDATLDLAQTQVSHVVLDLPHLWTGWARRVLLAADEVVITAAPDLANLKHAKHLVEMLGEARPDDPPPRLVLNQVGMPRRPEIAPREFAEVLELAPTLELAFDAQAFGTAANSGRMVVESSRRGQVPASFRKLAESLSGRAPKKRRGFAGLGWLMPKKKLPAGKA